MWKLGEGKSGEAIKRSEATSSGPERTQNINGLAPLPDLTNSQSSLDRRGVWSFAEPSSNFSPPRLCVSFVRREHACACVFNNTGSTCACLRACVSLCIAGRSGAMIFYDRVAVPQPPQLAIPFYRCNKVIFLSLSLDNVYNLIYQSPQ